MVTMTTTYHVYNTRYVAMALPAYVMILGGGIAGFRRLETRTLVFSAVLCVNGLSLFNYYVVPDFAREDARSAAQYLESVARSGDIVVSAGSSTALRYYYNGDVPVVSVKGRNSDLEVAKYVDDLARTYNRLWLIEIRQWEKDPESKVRAALDNLGYRVEHKKFPGVEVYSYDFTRLDSLR